MLLVDTGDFGIACGKSILGVPKEDGVDGPAGGGLLLCIRSGGGNVEMGAKARYRASAAEGFSACTMGDAENVFCFRNGRAVAGDDGGAPMVVAMSVAKSGADEREAENGLEEVGEGELGKLDSGTAGDF